MKVLSSDDIDKIIVLFSTKPLVRTVAKTCFLILRKRNNRLDITLKQYISVLSVYFNDFYVHYIYCTILFTVGLACCKRVHFKHLSRCI